MAIITGDKIGVFSIRNPLTGTLLVSGGPSIPVLIGTSNGRNVRVDSPEAVVHATTGGTDSLDYGPLASIISVADSTTGAGTFYRNGVDYTPLTTTVEGASVGAVDWGANTTINSPEMISATPAVGGTLAVDTYYYVMTAIRARTIPPIIYGETTQSNEVNATTNSTNGSIILLWNPVIGAAGYKIYRTLVTTSYVTPSLLTTVTGGGNVTYTDDGAVALAAGIPPVSNDAYRQPPVGATYYVDYYYKSIIYLSKELYTGLEELQADHGITSQLGIAGRLVMGVNGRGAAASQCYVIPISSHSVANHYLAMAEAEEIESLCFIVPLTTNMSILNDYFAHVTEMSDIWNKKERMLFCGAALGTEPGDTTTENSIIYNARIFGQEGLLGRRVVYVAPDGCYINVEDYTTNTVTETLYGGEMLAALFAGMASALPDPAEPATNDRVFGITRLYGSTYNISDNTIISNLSEIGGVSVFRTVNGVTRVYHAVTTARDTIENRELNIQLADDYVAKTMRDVMINQNLIGTKLTPAILKRIEGVARDTLSTMLSDQIIGDFGNVKANADSEDQRVVWCTFLYEPIYGCNAVVFERGFSL